MKLLDVRQTYESQPDSQVAMVVLLAGMAQAVGSERQGTGPLVDLGAGICNPCRHLGHSGTTDTASAARSGHVDSDAGVRQIPDYMQIG